MGTFDATTARNHFGRLLDACTKAPVAIEWHGRVVAYVLGAGQMPQVQALDTSLDARLAQRLQRVAAKKARIPETAGRRRRPGPQPDAGNPGRARYRVPPVRRARKACTKRSTPT